MMSVIDAHGLTKSYDGHRAIENVSFSVSKGEIYGFLGPNGAGKTTTIRLMLNFIRPTRGKLRIFGEFPGKGGPSLRRRIGYLPGEIGLYEHMRGDHALAFYRDLSGGQAPLHDWICEAIRLSPADRQRRIKTYSKGMKQKLAIAQAVQHDPDLLILDEPTTGLDPLVQADFNEVLHELKNRGKTIFLSSHVLSEVQTLCDRIGVLMDGRLILDADIPTLMARAERQLWILQPSDSGMQPAHPQITGTTFLRKRGDWLVYHVEPKDSGTMLEELANLKPLDFRFESAFEESFLDLYRERRAASRTKSQRGGERTS
ncbi:MAG: ATP-binding cassette domain-containing protein [Candidatus Sumerlaeaceae bacterium]|nr:ATP-binding cassette domain-containing protein [Candidatus Sumerlaeaceae bacterium]